MTKLGDYIVGWRNRFNKETHPISRNTPNYQKAQNIGILFHIKPEIGFLNLKILLDVLQLDGKKINTLAYSEKSLAVNPYSFDYQLFTNKDVSTLGQIKSEVVQQFIYTNFDYLYCIDLAPLPIFDSILMQSQAKCRIGRHWQGHTSHLELMIELQEGQTENDLMQQMVIYTKNITKN